MGKIENFFNNVENIQYWGLLARRFVGPKIDINIKLK